MKKNEAPRPRPQPPPRYQADAIGLNVETGRPAAEDKQSNIAMTAHDEITHSPGGGTNAEM